MDWIASISQVGFPIVAFLLVYLDLRKVIKHNTSAINELKEEIKTKLK